MVRQVAQLARRFIPETINLAARLVFSPILNYGASRTNQHMLLTIRTAHQPATDLGFLLHKHPDHVHTREFPFGNATVFYPEATDDACTAAVLLDVDPVGMVRGRDVASSLLSVVRSRWFKSALAGRCERNPCSVTVATREGKWQVWHCHSACFKRAPAEPARKT